ncbi:DUF4245 family protein [Microbacterium thalli]|uniref:DUF4245 family protein n=1 Tax=Microbacterium thalli TaxID=3027921 RepID=A0ABT5SLJ4_9MICO|nr:DUF4245 family protein [Microbacterium thalli]MDD7929505.1 DUF4245 family protein [Microbacterium thalli]MDD7962986.1 DUF4245 family protein [Microbacterium thalli]MDN8548522.1 DUF4245 family protein [Microbacterium thalli]
MAKGPRIVAELGRPETPDETAARKAASSRVYRSSQTTRNLIAALIVTVAVVAVIVFGVPRGSVPERPPIDVAAVAADIGPSIERDLVVPVVPETWRVNKAELAGDDVRTWEVVYAPASGYVNVQQGFDADAGWASRQISGARATTVERLGDVDWDVFEITDPSRYGNISYALSTTAGTDTILVYGGGAVDADTVREAARGLAPQIADLQKETR